MQCRVSVDELNHDNSKAPCKAVLERWCESDINHHLMLEEALHQLTGTIEAIVEAIESGDRFLVGKIVVDSIEDYANETEGYWS